MQSDRTAKYFEALNREGDKFDYHKWLQRAREEEAQAKGLAVASTSGEAAHVEIGNLNTTPTRQTGIVASKPPLGAGITPVRKPIELADQGSMAETLENRLRRRLLKVCDAWDDFQASRARNAVYRCLKAVYSIVMHYKVRRKTERLLPQVFRFAGLPFDNDADPFAAVIRCTCEGEVDNKTISKWSRALRYAAYSDVPHAELKSFMKEAGGVNACAARYARYYGRGGR